MAKLQPHTILFAVNYHALHLCDPDFLVYNDDPGTDPLLAEAVYMTTATRVSS